ncbi:hypothetical protein FHT09_002319 [Xanthomonas arboricola]|nr:hypothetical protein [Xanthomonas sp. CFBP 8152]
MRPLTAEFYRVSGPSLTGPHWCRRKTVCLAGNGCVAAGDLHRR